MLYHGICSQPTRFDGRVVDRLGDGFLATFDGPARAIRSACAIRDALSTIGLQVRAGIHTGEIETRGDDLIGTGVHIGARVAEHAEPGEILVSRTVVDLVAGSKLTFHDRGSDELKGIPNDWQLYAVAPERTANCSAEL